MKKRPNVIIVITDDQGYGDMACHGNPVALTPNLDKLHNESVRLNDFHVAPMCTPTRGQLLTGLDAARNGAVNVSSGRTLVRADLKTIADVFKDDGYHTGLFGKWHLGDNYPYRPQDRGFEETLWFPSSHINSLPDYWDNDYFDDVYFRHGKRERYEGYCTEVFFREAMNWMEEQIDKNEPFLTYLSTNAPHQPLWVPTEDREIMEKYFAEHEHELTDGETGNGTVISNPDSDLRSMIIRFLAMIHNVDTHVGKLRDFLKEKGIDRDTILIFMTDNGSTFGTTYYNAGMKGGKRSLWEGGHRVPCFINWPNGNLGEPRDIAGLTQIQDILPTLIECCNIKLDHNIYFDGVSLFDVLANNKKVDDNRELFVNFSRMPIDSDFFPVPNSSSLMRMEGAAVLWKHWRLLEGTALYNLENDPMQEDNVIDEYPDIAAKMHYSLTNWWNGVESLANEVQKIIVGNKKENPMILTACEWQDVFIDQQFQVRIGQRKNSLWNLQVEQAGNYRFKLRRWPEESGLVLDEACPETIVTDGVLEAGVALPIAQARIILDDKEYTKTVEPGQKSVVFDVTLDAGNLDLVTWFYDADNNPICGAYYVEVERNCKD